MESFLPNAFCVGKIVFEFDFSSWKHQVLQSISFPRELLIKSHVYPIFILLCKCFSWQFSQMIWWRSSSLDSKAEVYVVPIQSIGIIWTSCHAWSVTKRRYHSRIASCLDGREKGLIRILSNILIHANIRPSKSNLDSYILSHDKFCRHMEVHYQLEQIS